MLQKLWLVLICTIVITSAQPDSIEDKSTDQKEKQCFDHLKFMALIQKRVKDKEGVVRILASISGSFITYEHVLTTASSWIREMITSDDAKRNLEHFILIVGPIDINEPTNMSTHRSELISRAMVHPLFNRTGYQHDICIVMSWMRITGGIITPIAVHYDVTQKGPSNECRRGAILGWGDTSNTRTPESLYTLSCHEVELVENAEVFCVFVALFRGEIFGAQNLTKRHLIDDFLGRNSLAARFFNRHKEDSPTFSTWQGNSWESEPSAEEEVTFVHPETKPQEITVIKSPVEYDRTVPIFHKTHQENHKTAENDVKFSILPHYHTNSLFHKSPGGVSISGTHHVVDSDDFVFGEQGEEQQLVPAVAPPPVQGQDFSNFWSNFQTAPSSGQVVNFNRQNSAPQNVAANVVGDPQTFIVSPHITQKFFPNQNTQGSNTFRASPISVTSQQNFVAPPTSVTSPQSANAFFKPTADVVTQSPDLDESLKKLQLFTSSVGGAQNPTPSSQVPFKSLPNFGTKFQFITHEIQVHEDPQEPENSAVFTFPQNLQKPLGNFENFNPQPIFKPEPQTEASVMPVKNLEQNFAQKPQQQQPFRRLPNFEPIQQFQTTGDLNQKLQVLERFAESTGVHKVETSTASAGPERLHISFDAGFKSLPGFSGAAGFQDKPEDSALLPSPSSKSAVVVAQNTPSVLQEFDFESFKTGTPGTRKRKMRIQPPVIVQTPAEDESPVINEEEVQTLQISNPPLRRKMNQPLEVQKTIVSSPEETKIENVVTPEDFPKPRRKMNRPQEVFRAEETPRTSPSKSRTPPLENAQVQEFRPKPRRPLQELSETQKVEQLKTDVAEEESRRDMLKPRFQEEDVKEATEEPIRRRPSRPKIPEEQNSETTEKSQKMVPLSKPRVKEDVKIEEPTTRRKPFRPKVPETVTAATTVEPLRRVNFSKPRVRLQDESNRRKTFRPKGQQTTEKPITSSDKPAGPPEIASQILFSKVQEELALTKNPPSDEEPPKKEVEESVTPKTPRRRRPTAKPRTTSPVKLENVFSRSQDNKNSTSLAAGATTRRGRKRPNIQRRPPILEDQEEENYPKNHPGKKILKAVLKRPLGKKHGLDIDVENEDFLGGGGLLDRRLRSSSLGFEDLDDLPIEESKIIKKNLRDSYGNIV